MAQPRASNTGRAALIAMFLILLALFVGAIYLVIRPEDPSLRRIPPPADPSNSARRLSALLFTTLLAMALIVLFVLGAYLVIRAGRRVTSERAGGEETPVVDIWSRARVSDEELAAADEMLRDAQRPDPDAPPEPERDR